MTRREDPPEKAVLAVDVGSSSVRASLHSVRGEPLSPGVKLDYSFSYTRDGAATVDADALLDLVAQAIDGAVSGYKAGFVAVAFSTFWHSLLGLDASNKPTTPVLTWADRRAHDHAREAGCLLGPDRLHSLSGCPPHSSYWPAKLLWLESKPSSTFTSTSRWCSPGDYVYLNLFDRFSSGISMASATGLFDRNRLGWSGEVLDSLGVAEERLPPVSDEPMVGLAGGWAERWPGLAEVPWYPAFGDGACSSVGSGCVGVDRLALMVGTSGAMRVVWGAESAGVEPGLWCYRVDAKRFISGGALSDGGGLISWVRRTFRVPEDWEKRVSEMGPDAHGLTFLPLLSGERGPSWSDLANGVIAGLSVTTTPEEVLRAAMEAVALRFAEIRKKMRGISPDDARIVASGGGLVNSPAWARIMADVLGVPVEVSDVKEASSRGAALLALQALGHVDLEDEGLASVSYVVEPDGAAHEAYLGALERQKELYAKVFDASESEKAPDR